MTDSCIRFYPFHVIDATLMCGEQTKHIPYIRSIELFSFLFFDKCKLKRNFGFCFFSFFLACYFFHCSIHLYSSVIDNNAEKRELSAISDDEPDTGCSAIPATTTTQSDNLPNVSETDKSTESIDFSMSEAQNDTETQPNINDIDDKQSIECGSKQECNVKVQPSDCSVITLSSEESDGVVAMHDNSNQKNHEFNDDELFERSISCPPSELQDDLFEHNSGNDEMDNQTKRK